MAKTRKHALKNRSRKHGGDRKRREAKRRMETMLHKDYANLKKLRERLAAEKKESDELMKRMHAASKLHESGTDKLNRELDRYLKNPSYE